MNSSGKINLSKQGGPIVFLGSMNAMPMMYAWELKKEGFEVLYFVDSAIREKLSRPENHYPDIEYPYPKWIVEVSIKTQIFLPFFRKFFAKYLEYKVNKQASRRPQAYVLNGFFISLASYLETDVPKIALSHGSDLDSWADEDGSAVLSSHFCNYSIFKFFPKPIAKRLIAEVVHRQFGGFCAVDKAIYFPDGFNANGDRVLKKIKNSGVTCYQRYDISFDPLKNQSRNFKPDGEKLVVLSAVRFTYKSFSEGNSGYNKGNDILIKGLAKYCEKYDNLVIHFVEKGPDVAAAKSLCREVGLNPFVVWHKEMKFFELLKLYQESDICFDQVGDHWIGAVGCYALWLGKPLIANDKLPIKAGAWPKNNPVCSADSVDGVYRWLCKLRDEAFREELSIRSKEFSEKYVGPNKLLSEVFSFCD